MTREEFEELLGESWEDDSKAKTKYIDSLEQHIAELESSKTCEGCMYAQVRYYDSGTIWFKNVASSRCQVCSRNHEDYYKPKKDIE